MTASKSLPTRPSLESLRKQAKKLARNMAAGDADAIARARAHLPNVRFPFTQRNAQLTRVLDVDLFEETKREAGSATRVAAIRKQLAAFRGGPTWSEVWSF